MCVCVCAYASLRVTQNSLQFKLAHNSELPHSNLHMTKSSLTTPAGVYQVCAQLRTHLNSNLRITQNSLLNSNLHTTKSSLLWCPQVSIKSAHNCYFQVHECGKIIADAPVSLFAHTNTHTYINIHTYIHMPRKWDEAAYVCVCVYMCVHKMRQNHSRCAREFVCMCMCVFTCVCVCICMCMYAHKNRHTHTYRCPESWTRRLMWDIHVCVYVCIHVWMYACVYTCNSQSQNTCMHAYINT